MTISKELERIFKVCGKCRHYNDADDSFCMSCVKIDREFRKLTHRQLCELGARFILSLRHPTGYPWRILIETGYRAENPDVFAYTKYHSILIECKTSRSDFLADMKKPFRQNPQIGIGERRLYLVNQGVCTQNEMPKGWQLLIAYDKDTILLPENFLSPESNAIDESEKCYDFIVRNASAEIELMWSWEYRKERKCLPEIPTDLPNMINPFYWKQGDKVVADILKGV